MVLKWTEEVRRRGATGCYLATDAVDNDPVNNFYKSLGWQIESAYKMREGRIMNRYILDFDTNREHEVE